jgi:hypothetical protein
MSHASTRRSFIRLAGTTAVLGAFVSLASATDASRPPPPPKPPALPPEKVQATVGQAHRSLEAVRALVDETPLLVNACWDWGGGDFETPLEAAAHTGRREIAEFLLARGARPSLFAAAMLGQLELVRAFLALDPKAHEIPGPHGFTLLHCAKQGGADAQPVVDWLLAQGVPPETQRPLKFNPPVALAPDRHASSLLVASISL